MKKEFRLIRILWRQIYDNVAAVDELNMSVMRLRLRFDDEPYVPQGNCSKLRVPKVAYCCFFHGPYITFLWCKTAESQLKKVMYGLSLHSSDAHRADAQIFFFENSKKFKKNEFIALLNFILNFGHQL
jgi:hypothetical protein